MRREPWKLKDVVMMAILGVLFAVVYMAVFYGGTAISVALTPLGLSAFGFELIYGVWFMAATIAAYIIRKPGAALIELLMGNSGGATVVLTGLIQGVGCELGFAVFRYRKYNLLSMALSGVFAAVCIFCYELYYLSYYLLAPTMLAAQLAVRFASAVVFSGVIAKLACDGLARTGVLRSYAVGARLAPVSIDDEEE